VLVAEELARDENEVAVVAHDLDVRDQVLEAGDRFLGPVDAGVDLADAAAKDVLALVEVGNLGLRVGELELPVADVGVPADWHEVVHTVGKEVEPVVETALVEVAGLAEEEVLDLLLEHHPLQQSIVAAADLGHSSTTSSTSWKNTASSSPTREALP